MTSCPGAIVAGASYRALAVVRSLCRHGVPVWVLQTDEHSIAGHSRFALGTARWPRGDDRGRYDSLLQIVEHHRLTGWALIATDDEDAATMARLHHALSEHLVPTVPPWDVLEAAYDKRVMHAVATGAEIAQPATLFPGGAEELSRVLAGIGKTWCPISGSTGRIGGSGRAQPQVRCQVRDSATDSLRHANSLRG